MRFGLYPRCLPYHGPRDAARETSLQQYLLNNLRAEGVTFIDVIFTEEEVPQSTIVQPGIAIHYEVQESLVQDQHPHQIAVLAVDAALAAAGLQGIEYVFTVVSGQSAAGVALGGLTGLIAGLAGGSASKSSPTESAVRGALLGAVIGALFGGVIGDQIKRDGPALGVWRKQQTGAWTLYSTQQIVPGGPIVAV